MSWLRSAVNKAVEAGGNRRITRNLRSYAGSVVQHAGYAIVDGVKIIHDRSGPGNFKSFKHTLKRLEEQSVSCRGIERLQQLRRWLVALKEIERIREAKVEPGKNNDLLGATMQVVLYYDPELGGEPLTFKDVFLRSQALEGIVLSMILEAPDEEEVSLLTEIFGLCLTGGKEVCDATIASIEALAKAFSSYNDELLAKKEDLLLFAQSAISGLKINADITRIDYEVSNIQQDLNKMQFWPPSREVDNRSSGSSTSTTTEAWKELSQIQVLSKLESLLLQEKSLLNKSSTGNHFQKIDKLKVLSESLLCSASKSEKRIYESRLQKEGALSFRVSKTDEFSQLEKELTTEIKELQRKKDELEAELKKVNTALTSAHAHLHNAREERDQFYEASNQILQHFHVKEDELSRSIASYRAEADVCDAFIYFLEDTQGFESSYAKQKQKLLNEELARFGDYFVELVIHVLSAYKDELGPSVSNVKKLAEDLRGSEISAAASNGENKSAVDARRRLEEEYLKAENKLITAFSVVESVEKQFYAQAEGLSRKDNQNVKELFDDLKKIKEELESMHRPSLEVEISNKKRAETLTGTPPQPSRPISHGSAQRNETQRSMRDNLRRSLSMAIRHTNDTVNFVREDGFTPHKLLRTKSVDPAAELHKLTMELELENSSREHTFDEIYDWESDLIEKERKHSHHF